MAEQKASLMHRLRLRTTLLIPLLLLCFGFTPISLLILQTIVRQQVQGSLSSDLQHSVKTYENQARQRRELLVRESALLADLPSLKALMTVDDSRTIEDGGSRFWKVSGSDFFALLDRNGNLIVSYNQGPPLDRTVVGQGLEGCLRRSEDSVLLAFGSRLYEVSIQPLVFGDQDSQLGFVAVGYAVDERVAREVSEAAAAEVTFTVGKTVVASTLQPALEQQFVSHASELTASAAENRTLRLGKEDYLAASVPLGPENQNAGVPVPQLVVLKSFAQATQLVSRVNRWVLTLVLVALLAGATMLVSISRTLTRPIETLVEGTRALALGNFNYRLSEDGVEEIRELSRAFERMRVELQRSQSDLLDSERLATIGRMASSISHDLRHYLSAMYANAEFMSSERLPQAEREELFLEVKNAVQGMTDLLDSLLLFTQTGRALEPSQEYIATVVQRAVGMVRSHPAARDVRIVVTENSTTEAWIDSKKLGRAVYNLLLNACQAARRGKDLPLVALNLDEDESSIRIKVSDNGPGVPESIRKTMFLPFVSEGKESGVGLGLTLAQQIAQEHGGTIELQETLDGYSVFIITLPKAALRALGAAADRKALQAS
ncbi:MAG TPA: ATP-binding protein [Acidobacteriaceae bacterium]|jgi:signal transduction histidine kinase